MNRQKLALLLLSVILSFGSVTAMAATDAQKKMELLRKLDQLDALDFNDALNRANSCISRRDFTCAETQLKKASRLAKSSQQRSHLASTQSNLDRERSRMSEEKRALERERRRLAEQERRWEEEQERLREMEREQERASKPDAWGAVIGGLETLNRDLESQYGTVDQQFQRTYEKARQVQQEAVRQQREKAERERKEYLRRQQAIADQREQAQREQARRHEQERQQLQRERQRYAQAQKANCERDGGRYDAATNNCTIVKKKTTFIVQDFGTNKVFDPTAKASSQGASQATAAFNSASNSGAKGRRASDNSKGNSIASQSGSGKQEKERFDIKENRTLCWSRINKRTQKEEWKCSGEIHTSIYYGKDLESTSRAAGCNDIRRDFHNINFTHPREPDLKYERAIIRACGEPYEAADEKVDEKFRIHYPASVIMTRYRCTSKTFLGDWRKYCTPPA